MTASISEVSFERSTLKLDPARRNIKAESKVDVKNVTGIVNHDVTVMSVF